MNISDTATYCLHCGTQFGNQFASQTPGVVTSQPTSVQPVYANPNVQSQTIVPNKKVSTITKGDIISLVLSLLNASLLLPVGGYFFVLWFIFGAFSGSIITYYGVLLATGFYCLGSIIWVLKAIWNIIKYNSVLRTLFKIFIIVMILLVIGGCCFQRYAPLKWRQAIDNSGIGYINSYRAKNDLVYESEDLVIKVVSIKETKYWFSIKLSVENKSDLYYNIDFSNEKVNDFDDFILHRGSGSYFGEYNPYIEPHSTSDNYVLEIHRNSLDSHGLTCKDIQNFFRAYGWKS